MLYNIIIVLLIIGVIYLMSNGEKLENKYNKHSVKIIFGLLILYMIVNKIYHGVAVLLIVFVVYYHKEIRKKLNIKKLNLQFFRDNIEKYINKSEEKNNEKTEEKTEEEKKEEENIGDIFNEIDKLEEVASKSNDVATEPFKDMVTNLRETFNSIYTKLGEQK